MRATVQYEDFIGSAAADISDHFSLAEFLQQHNVDTERFQAIGAEFYSGYSDYFSVSVICIDSDHSNDDKKHLVSISFENDITKDEFFDLFKRFNVVITKKFGNYDRCEINERILLDENGKIIDV